MNQHNLTGKPKLTAFEPHSITPLDEAPWLDGVFAPRLGTCHNPEHYGLSSDTPVIPREEQQ